MEIDSLKNGVIQGLQQCAAVLLWHILRGFSSGDGRQCCSYHCYTGFRRTAVFRL